MSRVTCCCAIGILLSTPASAQEPLDYPEARRVDVIDTYHGVQVDDPYRWMEQTETEEVQGWVHAQVDLFNEYVGEVATRDALEARVAAIGRFESVGTPTRVGDRSFFSRTPADSSRGIWYVQQDGGEPRVLLDTNTYFDDPSHRVLSYSPSPDGRHVAFGVDDGAGTWGRVRILDVDSGKELGEELIGTSGPIGFPGVNWTSDGEAFTYFHMDVRDPDGDTGLAIRNVKIKMHRLSTPQTEDPVLFARPDRPDLFINSQALTTDDRYLITSITERSSRRTLRYAIDLVDRSALPIELADETASMSHITNNGTVQLYRTDLDAPRFRVIGIDIENPERENWIEVVPEGTDTLTSVSAAKDYLIARYDRDVTPRVEVLGLDGQHVAHGKLPGIGGVRFATSPRHNDVYYSFGVLFDPGTTYRLDPTTGESTLFFRPELAFNPDNFEISQVFYSSFDGTRVPMFIAHKKGLDMSQPHPLWMYGFGSSGWMAFPWFQGHLVVWMEMGGIYALPGIRGGGEYGAEWREAGMKRNKGNTIGDYLAAAEWLIEKGYSSSDLLVANGGSASGPLPAIAINRRPDLFGAAVIDFPFLDMLRYHIFASGFTRSYGSPDDPGDFAVLHSYSPYHNIREGQVYPPTLITVAEKDVSTPPLHVYKHTAALQHAQSGTDPILMQMIWGAGHYSYGKNPQESARNRANQIAFLLRALGMNEELSEPLSARD